MADSAALGPKSSPTTYRINQSARMDKTASSLNRLCATEEAAFSVDNAVVKKQANASDTKPNPPTRKVLLCTTRRAGQDSNHLTSDEEEDEDEDDDEEEEECRLQPPGFDPNDDKKRRRSDRYDSSESSDSGVASLTCSDASSWSSSSDITEPVSPASPASSHPSPLSQTSASEVHSPSAATVPSPSQEADAEAEGKNCNACDAARPAAAQKVDASCKRRRRFSDSAPQTTAEARPTQRKRARRLSGSCSGSSSCDFPCGAAVASKWSAYSCLWRNKWNSSATRGPVAAQCKLDVSPHRLSWPVCRDELKKTGQMKITEFFSSQVKQHWNYQHKTSAIKVEEPDRRIDLQDGSPTRCDGLPEACRESRVSIVSVAHVDPSVDSNFSPNVQNLVDSAEQAESSSRQPASPLCPTEASNGGDQSHLEANGQSSSAATPQIRFPVDQGKNDSSLVCTVVQCLWKDCGVSVNLTSGQSLLEHIHSVHVASQAGSQSSSTSSSSSETTERYVCEWEGCKVQGRTSSSRAWLERHVLTHGGNKPFRCIVESCDQRFSSQAALQRHVNAHFSQEGGQSNGGSNGLKRENGHVPAKVLRRNSKKLKYRRKAAPARLFDYFDTGIMERLRYQLLDSQQNETRLGLSPLANSLTVSSQVIARRLDRNGKTRVLVRWTPEEILPDQWMLESEVVARKVVPLHTLSTAAQIKVHHMLNPPAAGSARKQRRK